MKSLVLMIVFAVASVNFMQTDVRVVEIAQGQSNSSVMLASR